MLFNDVMECIETLSNWMEESDTKTDCDSVLKEILGIEFIISLDLYEISRVNIK